MKGILVKMLKRDIDIISAYNKIQDIKKHLNKVRYKISIHTHSTMSATEVLQNIWYAYVDLK